MSLNIKSDDEIREIINQQIKAWDNKLSNILITWFEYENTYDLELHFDPISTDEEPFLLGCRPEGANGIIKIGSLSSYDYDNWENFWQYARDLYARLKEEYPQHKLKRKLNFDW